MPKTRRVVPGVDPKFLIKDAAKLLPDPSRRLFLRGATSVGAVALLSGCDIVDGDTAANALMAISRFNDRVQALIFNPWTLWQYLHNMTAAVVTASFAMSSSPTAL